MKINQTKTTMSKETLTAETFFKEREPQAFEVLLPNHINLISELMEEYHKAKVNAITDEEIDKVFQLDKNVHPMHQSKVLNKRKGAKWFKNRLLNGK